MTQASPQITRQALYEAVWARPLSQVAAELGLSAGGLSKICDRLLIPYPSRGRRTKAHGADRPPLPAPPAGARDPIRIAPERAPARRARTRLPAETRREQLIDAAAALIEETGLAGATMKAVARRVGLSEAQAHNYFPQRRDLLVALAQRELQAMEGRRRDELGRGHDRYTRVTLSTITYLREVAERGALIELLTRSADVREALRQERQASRSSDAQRVSEDLSTTYGLPPELALGATRVLTALTRRAGRLLAEGKIPLETAERLTLAMVTAGNRELARAYRPAPDAVRPAPSSPAR
jgi:AcrR family transcriptional regulator